MTMRSAKIEVSARRRASRASSVGRRCDAWPALPPSIATNDSSRMSSQFASFVTSSTKLPSRANVNATAVCSASCASAERYAVCASNATARSTRRAKGLINLQSDNMQSAIDYDTRMKLGLLLAVITASLAASLLHAQTKVDIVKVVGCLREQGTGNWMLVAATEPEVSSANAPPRTEVPKEAPAGKSTYKLIGVGEFNLPAYRDHTVLVKALYIKDTVSRLNLTSVTDAVPNCAPGAPK